MVNLAIFTWALQTGRSVAHAMTLTFVSLVLIQFFKAYNFRSDRRSIFHRPLANKWLNLAIVWELGLLLFIVSFPPLHEPFGTHALSAREWLISSCAALTVAPVLELAKWLERRGWLGKLA
jgi:Ca2+-transporting ATPase